MIFVSDKGQMCNNLFQYIQLYSWGRENGRTTMSMRFAYKYKYWHISSTRYHNLFFHLLGKFLAEWHVIPTVDFDKVSSLQDGLDAISRTKHCFVQGWNHIRLPQLVEKYHGEILQLFSFRKEVRDAAVLRMDKSADIHIGVHIRRGDYKTFRNGVFFFNDKEFIAYINKTLALLPSDKKKSVYICTNDREIDKAYFQKNISALVSFPDGNAGEDLCLLSECDYLVGPTSSYSLVATLYGKARLHWMLHSENVEELQLTDFEGFQTLSGKMDWNFIFADADYCSSQ